jgi:hypothetical protein
VYWERHFEGCRDGGGDFILNCRYSSCRNTQPWRAFLLPEIPPRRDFLNEKHSQYEAARSPRADEMIESRRREISEMKALIKDLENTVT